MKKILLGFVLGILLCGVGVYAATQYKSEEVKYKNDKSVKDALDDLYLKTKMCKRLSEGTGLTVGTKYECTLGDKDNNNNYTKRNFFIIAVNSNNTVDLIMERNITEGTTRPDNFDSAMNYFKTGDGVKYTNAWTNVVDIKLPSADMIASAAGGSASTITPLTNTKWLFNYLKNCDQYGCDENTSLSEPEPGCYNTSTTGNENGSEPNRLIRCVCNNGTINVCTRSGSRGIRPVITVLKTQLN